VLGGLADAVVSWDGQVEMYEAAPTPKRLVGISNAGHLAMTDLCGGRNLDGQDSIEIAEEYGVCGVWAARFLWDCEPTHLAQDRGTEIINYATTAALEETLQCANRDVAFAEILTRYPEIGVYDEDRTGI
jgi:predicted heme/steroid binding protein